MEAKAREKGKKREKVKINRKAGIGPKVTPKAKAKERNRKAKERSRKAKVKTKVLARAPPRNVQRGGHHQQVTRMSRSADSSRSKLVDIQILVSSSILQYVLIRPNVAPRTLHVSNGISRPILRRQRLRLPHLQPSLNLKPKQRPRPRVPRH